MPQPSDGTIEVVEHSVRRITIQVDAPFEEFRSRYEEAVPAFQAERFASLVEARASWQDVLDATADNAPRDFIIYWSGDFTELMRLAGDRGRCVEYLMGNHTIAQRMYRYNPAILLYAPLRTAIVEDADGNTWFTLDQPSSCFGSFNTPQVTKVGLELDHKVAALLVHLGLRVPEELAYSLAARAGRLRALPWSRSRICCRWMRPAPARSLSPGRQRCAVRGRSRTAAIAQLTTRGAGAGVPADAAELADQRPARLHDDEG